MFSMCLNFSAPLGYHFSNFINFQFWIHYPLFRLVSGEPIKWLKFVQVTFLKVILGMIKAFNWTGNQENGTWCTRGPVKIQFNLRCFTIWYKSLLPRTQSLALGKAIKDQRDSYQPALMRRLIWKLADRICEKMQCAGSRPNVSVSFPWQSDSLKLTEENERGNTNLNW